MTSEKKKIKINEQKRVHRVWGSALALVSVLFGGTFGALDLSLAASGHEVNRDCFRIHLDEAIALNQERDPLYRAVSDGRSRAISSRLIGLEKLALLANRVLGLDRRARVYQNAGIPILCSEFVSMELTPKFRARSPRPWPSLNDFVPVDGAVLARTLRHELNKNGLEGLAAAVEAKLEELNHEPRFHCMVKHVLESLARTARLAPTHEAQAKALGLPSPRHLSDLFIWAQLQTLYDSADLDASAAPLQAEGIAILCQDVPPIEIPEKR